MRKIKVVLFGAGIIGREVLSKLGKHIKVLAFTDNDTGKHGMFVSGIPVIEPAEITKLDYEHILITSTSISDISDQLQAMGIEEQEIVIVNEAKPGSSSEFPWDAVLFLFFLVTVFITFLVIYFLSE